MAQFQPASFIPKQPLTPQAPLPQRKRAQSINVLMVIAVVLFVATLVASAGVFFYQRFIVSRIANKRVALEEVQKTLNPELIRELVRFDMRLKKATVLLDDHTVVTPFLSALDASTLRSVQFTSFDLARGEDGRFVATLAGVTRNYTNVALQSDQFGANDYFLDPIVSDFSLNETGNVEFKVRMTVDPALLSYTSQVRESVTSQ